MLGRPAATARQRRHRRRTRHASSRQASVPASSSCFSTPITPIRSRSARFTPRSRGSLEAALAPDDVIAVMTPEMSARDVTFLRKAGGVATALEPVRQWASQDPSRLRDPDEQRYTLCFPAQGETACPDVVGPNQQGPMRAFAPYDGVALEMAARRHGQRSVQALVELSRTLRAVNDGRKAIVLLSGGWPLFRENLALARMVRCGPAEQRGSGDEPRQPARREGMADVADQTICEADRRRLAELDLQAAFQRMLDGVNTATVSVYPFDTGGADRVIACQAGEPGPRARAGGSAGGLRDVAAPAGRADRRRRTCRPGQVVERTCPAVAGPVVVLPGELSVDQRESRRRVSTRRRHGEAARRHGSRPARLSRRHGRRTRATADRRRTGRADGRRLAWRGAGGAGGPAAPAADDARAHARGVCAVRRRDTCGSGRWPRSTPRPHAKARGSAAARSTRP